LAGIVNAHMLGMTWEQDWE